MKSNYATSTIPQFCIFENVIALAQQKGYQIIMHTPYQSYPKEGRIKYTRGNIMRNMEISFVSNWLLDKFMVYCWASPVGKYYRPCSKDMSHRSGKKINLEVVKSKDEALAIAITNELKQLLIDRGN